MSEICLREIIILLPDLQSYPQAGRDEAPEEDEQAETPVYGDDAFTVKYTLYYLTCYGDGLHHHRVVEAT